MATVRGMNVMAKISLIDSGEPSKSAARGIDLKCRPLVWVPWVVPRQFVYGHFVSTLRLQTFRLLLHTSVQDSYTSNFCLRKSLLSSISTSTCTMIPFYQSHFH